MNEGVVCMSNYGCDCDHLWRIGTGSVFIHCACGGEVQTLETVIKN